MFVRHTSIMSAIAATLFAIHALSASVESSILNPTGSGSSSASSPAAPGGRELNASTRRSRDVVDEFLRIVEQYEKNQENCTPGTTFNLGDGVVAQYGLRRYRRQAMIAVDRANLLTRLWKQHSIARTTSGLRVETLDLLNSDYFFYAAVRSMVESDDDLFAAGNCYDRGEYKKYELFCPYAYRMKSPMGRDGGASTGSRIMVKDLSVEYKYLGMDSEFFYEARMKAARKLTRTYRSSVG